MSHSKSTHKNDHPADHRMKSAHYTIGLLLILIAVASSAMLTYAHLSGKTLPGCGEGSGCAALSSGRYGKIPFPGGYSWPTAYLGLTYFLALIPGWLLSRRGLNAPLRWLLRLGTLASIGFLYIMFFEEHKFCQYCIAAHLANLALLGIAEVSGKPVTRTTGPLPFAASFILATIALFAVDSQISKNVEKKEKAELIKSTEQIIDQSAGTNNDPLPTPNYDWGPNGFTGRYRLGPENAPIRVVLYSDYQCRDCKRIEGEIIALFHQRNDMSVSIKHTPFNQDCNPFIGSSPHTNACWAARAAEAAGLIKGNDGFWAMSEWLFAHNGGFTNDDLQNGLVQLGYSDIQQFLDVMGDHDTTIRVLNDVNESHALGLYYTPMVFINGVQLKGVFASFAVQNTIEALAATNPPRRTAHYDNPPLALEKYIADWREQPKLVMPSTADAKLQGEYNAPVAIRLWGDAQEPNTREAYLEIRRLMKLSENSDVSFAFFNCPWSSACSTLPNLPLDRFPLSCRTTRVIEAGKYAGGKDGYWAMLDYVMSNPDTVDDDNALRIAAAERGINPENYIQAISSPEIDYPIKYDLLVTKEFHIREIPWLYINGHRLIHRRINGKLIIKDIIEAARQDPSF